MNMSINPITLYNKTMKEAQIIIKESQSKPETFGVNIIGESLIIAVCKRMSLHQKEQFRLILNKLIKHDKIKIKCSNLDDKK